MTIIKPQDVSQWTHRLIDVRNPDEFAAERLVSASECVPLGVLAGAAATWDRARPVLLLCKSGGRARQAAEQLEALGFEQISLVEGGIDGCRKAGVELISGAGPMPLFRQVMIAAGSFVLIGLALALIHPGFLALDVIVGGGLVIAGSTGICPMARLLAVMPWNAPKACAGGSCSVRH